MSFANIINICSRQLWTQISLKYAAEAVIRVQNFADFIKIADKALASWIIAARKQIGSEKTEKYYWKLEQILMMQLQQNRLRPATKLAAPVRELYLRNYCTSEWAVKSKYTLYKCTYPKSVFFGGCD